jgi:hypothetical protein
LAEAVTAPAPGEDQGHGRSSDRAIIMTDKTLQNPCLAAAAARSGGRGDTLLIGSAKQQGHKSGLVEQARGGQGFDKGRIALVVGRDPSARKGCANSISDIANEALEHCGHQRPLLLGQAFPRIEEEVSPNGRQTPAARGTRSAVPVGCRCSNGPFLGHHPPALADSG